jgi:hypothetical protein
LRLRGSEHLYPTQLPDWQLFEVELLLIGLNQISLTNSGFNPLIFKHAQQALELFCHEIANL